MPVRGTAGGRMGIPAALRQTIGGSAADEAYEGAMEDTDMQQLTGLDNLFLSIDAGPVTNAVIGDLILYEPSDDPDAGSRDRVINRISQRLGAVPPLRRITQGLPVGINNVYLREVEVDVAEHVREIRLPTGSTHRDLEAAVSAIMEEPLSTVRPMWDFVVIRGLEDGRVAHLFRVHHGIVDGPTLPLVIDLLSDEPSHDPENVSGSPGGRLPVPEVVEIVARGLVNTAMTPLRLLSIQGRTLSYLLSRTKAEGVMALPAYVARMLPGGMSRPLSAIVNGHQRMIGGTPVRPLIPAMTIQKTPFNGRLTERRTYVFETLPLRDVIAAGEHFAVSVDDILVAVCAGALRRYMERYGDVPDRPLILCVPASIRTGKEDEPWATHLSMLFAEFPTNVEDPLVRVQLVHEDLRAARATFDALPMHMLRDVSRLVPLTMLNVSMKLLSRAPEWVPGTPWNVVVSTVPLRDDLSMCGATMAAQWPVGFLTPGMGLNISIHTHGDKVDVGFCGCPDLMPDIRVLAEYTASALEEMTAARAAAPKAAKPSPRRPRLRPAGPPAAGSPGSTAPAASPVAAESPGDTASPAGSVTAAEKPRPRRPRVRPTDGRETPAATPLVEPATEVSAPSESVESASVTDGGEPATAPVPADASARADENRPESAVTAAAEKGGDGSAPRVARRSTGRVRKSTAVTAAPRKRTSRASSARTEAQQASPKEEAAGEGPGEAPVTAAPRRSPEQALRTASVSVTPARKRSPARRRAADTAAGSPDSEAAGARASRTPAKRAVSGRSAKVTAAPRATTSGKASGTAKSTAATKKAAAPKKSAAAKKGDRSQAQAAKSSAAASARKSSARATARGSAGVKATSARQARKASAAPTDVDGTGS